MRLTVRYFASLREALGPQQMVEVVAGCTVAALRDQLIAGSTRHAQALGRERALRCAVGQVLVDESVLLVEDVEVAFFPPLTGG